MKYFIPIISAVMLASCTMVPQLVSHEDMQNQYRGMSVDVLYDQYGLPDLEKEMDNGNVMMTWFQGTSNNGASIHWGYGIYSHMGEQTQNKMTAVVGTNGAILNIDTNGYSLGNDAEVQAAEANNALWGGLGLLTVLTLILGAAGG